jgi:hypothetical protein
LLSQLPQKTASNFALDGPHDWPDSQSWGPRFPDVADWSAFSAGSLNYVYADMATFATAWSPLECRWEAGGPCGGRGTWEGLGEGGGCRCRIYTHMCDSQ